MDHGAWMAAATEEYGRLLALLQTLDEASWSAATDCAEWEVRAIVAHLVGSAEAAASVREVIRQRRAGQRLRPGGSPLDAMNELQVRERADLSPRQLVAQLAEVAPRALTARRRLPKALRVLRVPLGPPLGTRPLGYLTDCIYTRDGWMHRIDICRATQRQPHLTADHDGGLVADVVQEWARLHGQPFQLTLTGMAGGTFTAGTGGERLELDAVEFCRLLSGRGQQPSGGLLAVQVPF